MLWRTFSLVFFMGISSLAVLPQGCEEKGEILEQLNYLTDREDYQPPEDGTVTIYQTNGPVSGGSVQALASGSDGLLYAGFFGDGIYKSTDAGEQWRPAKTGFGDPFIISLLVHPDGTVYAGTVRDGIFRSEDGGKSWISSSSGLTNKQIASLAIGNRQTVYAGTGAGVFVSRDGGRHWIPHNKELEIVLVRSIAVSPTGSVFIGTAGEGILKSDNMGKDWEPISKGLEDEFGMRENFIRTLTFSKDGILYAGSFGGGIFRSSDDGRTWDAVNTGLPNLSIRALVIGRDGRLFAGTGQGVFSSEDGGEHWVTVSEALPDVNVQSMSLDPHGNLYVGTGTGIFKKARNSNAWQVLDRGLLFPIVQALSFDPERGIFAGTYGSGVFRSRDAGNIWEPMSQGIGSANVRILVQDRDHTLYAGTEKGVYRGDRKARQWVNISEGLEDQGITSLVMTKDNTLYAGTSRGLYRRSIDDFLDASENGSITWSEVNIPSSFEDSDSPGPETGEGRTTGIGSPVHSVAVGPGSEIFVAIRDRLYRQRDKNRPWELIQMEPLPEKILGITAGDAIYLWTEHEILQGKRSKPGAIKWQSIRQGIPFDHKIRTVLITQGNQGTVIFTGTDRGLFWSRDQGKNWQRAQGRKADFPVEIILSPTEGLLIVGSSQQGVFLAVSLLPRSGIFGLL